MRIVCLLLQLHKAFEILINCMGKFLVNFHSKAIKSITSDVPSSSKTKLSGCIVELVVVYKEPKRLFKLIHCLVSLLSFVDGYMLSLDFSIGASFRLGLLHFFLSRSSFSLLFDVRLRVPMDVQAVGTVFLEE